MKLGRLIACMALAGCASGGARVGDDAAPREQTIRLESGGQGTQELRSVGSDPRGTFAIQAPPDRVYSTLSVAYQELGITPTVLNTQTRLIGVDNARLRRSIGGTRLGRYLTCGERMGIQIADSDEIFLTLQTQVLPGESNASSTLRTVVQASARPTGSGSGVVSCATTGALEARIVELVKKHAGG